MVALLIGLQFEVNQLLLVLKSDTGISACHLVRLGHRPQGLDENLDEDDLDDWLASLAEPASRAEVFA